MNIDALRNLAGILNRQKPTESNRRVMEELFSPPVKGDKINPKEYIYPVQLSGLHQHGSVQRIRISGNTSGNSNTISTGGNMGVNPGGAYLT